MLTRKFRKKSARFLVTAMMVALTVSLLAGGALATGYENFNFSGGYVYYSYSSLNDGFSAAFTGGDNWSINTAYNCIVSSNVGQTIGETPVYIMVTGAAGAFDYSSSVLMYVRTGGSVTLTQDQSQLIRNDSGASSVILQNGVSATFYNNNNNNYVEGGVGNGTISTDINNNRYAVGTFNVLTGSYTLADDGDNNAQTVTTTTINNTNYNSVSSNATINGNNQKLIVAGGTVYVNDVCSVVNANGGTTYVSTNNTVVGNGGALVVTGGTVNVSGTFSSITLNGGTVNVTADTTVTGSASGIIVNNNATLNIGDDRNTPTVTNTYAGNRTGVTVNGGTCNLNAGTVNVSYYENGNNAVYGISASGGTVNIDESSATNSAPSIKVDGNMTVAAVSEAIHIEGTATVNYTSGYILFSGSTAKGVSVGGTGSKFTMGTANNGSAIIKSNGGADAIGIFSSSGSAKVYSGEIDMDASEPGIGIEITAKGNLEVLCGTQYGSGTTARLKVHTSSVSGSYGFEVYGDGKWAIRGRGASFVAPTPLYVVNSTNKDSNGYYPLSGGTFVSNSYSVSYSSGSSS